jgi:hypothetical protein
MGLSENFKIGLEAAEGFRAELRKDLGAVRAQLAGQVRERREHGLAHGWLVGPALYEVQGR